MAATGNFHAARAQGFQVLPVFLLGQAPSLVAFESGILSLFVVHPNSRTGVPLQFPSCSATVAVCQLRESRLPLLAKPPKDETVERKREANAHEDLSSLSRA
jgi:hypothetical protein